MTVEVGSEGATAVEVEGEGATAAGREGGHLAP